MRWHIIFIILVFFLPFLVSAENKFDPLTDTLDAQSEKCTKWCKKNEAISSEQEFVNALKKLEIDCNLTKEKFTANINSEKDLDSKSDICLELFGEMSACAVMAICLRDSAYEQGFTSLDDSLPKAFSNFFGEDDAVNCFCDNKIAFAEERYQKAKEDYFKTTDPVVKQYYLESMQTWFEFRQEISFICLEFWSSELCAAQEDDPKLGEDSYLETTALISHCKFLLSEKRTQWENEMDAEKKDELFEEWWQIFLKCAEETGSEKHDYRFDTDFCENNWGEADMAVDVCRDKLNKAKTEEEISAAVEWCHKTLSNDFLIGWENVPNDLKPIADFGFWTSGLKNDVQIFIESFFYSLKDFPGLVLENEKIIFMIGTGHRTKSFSVLVEDGLVTEINYNSISNATAKLNMSQETMGAIFKSENKTQYVIDCLKTGAIKISGDSQFVSTIETLIEAERLINPIILPLPGKSSFVNFGGENLELKTNFLGVGLVRQSPGVSVLKVILNDFTTAGWTNDFSQNLINQNPVLWNPETAVYEVSPGFATEQWNALGNSYSENKFEWNSGNPNMVYSVVKQGYSSKIFSEHIAKGRVFAK